MRYPIATISDLTYSTKSVNGWINLINVFVPDSSSISKTPPGAFAAKYNRGRSEDIVRLVAVGSVVENHFDSAAFLPFLERHSAELKSLGHHLCSDITVHNLYGGFPIREVPAQIVKEYFPLCPW